MFEYTWDHGTPLVGAHTDVVYWYRGQYYAAFSYDGRLIGPLRSLDDALTDELLGVNSATQAVWTSELSRADLIRRLVLYDDAGGCVIEVNGKPWRVPRRQITLAAVRARLADWLSTCKSRSQSQVSSYATLVGTRLASGDAYRLEAVLARLARQRTWETIMGVLRALRLALRDLDTERQDLLRQIEEDRHLPQRDSTGP